MEDFFCPYCGNTDKKTFGYRNGHYYCRKCLTFRGKEAVSYSERIKDADYKLDYELSDDQKRLSFELIDNFKNGYNSLVHAVCGSGKTEIVLEVIKYAINIGYKVGFTVPRRDVIIELKERFQNIFKKNKIALVYGGHTNKLVGDMVCLTAHQLYRYDHYFDLLIMDEVDAFPYKGNEVLEAFFFRALKGNYIFMSATPSDEFLNKFLKSGGKILELNTRFHGFPLPIPKVKIRKSILIYISLYRLIKKYVKEDKQVFIFAPTIEMCESLYLFLKFLIKKGNFVHSKCNDREQRIKDFKAKKYMYLVTTAVLERGVTVKNLQVIIFRSDHNIYDSYSLIQIAGRVGRKKDCPYGDVIYLAKEQTNEMDKSIREIKNANKYL